MAPKTETGLADLPNGLSSSTRDFLPLLQLGGLIGAIDATDKNGIVAVALNPRTGPEFRNLQIRALINSKPQLYQPLKAALDADTINVVDAEIAKGKNRQDVTLETSVNLTGYQSGRNIAAYAELVNAFFDRTGTSVVESFQAAGTASRKALRKELGQDRENIALKDLPADVRQTAEGLALAYATAMAAGSDALAAAMKDRGLLLLPQMINNQPQTIVSLAYAWRDPLVGPTGVVTGRIAYEKARGADLKSFLRRQGFDYDDCVSAAKVATCYQAFIEYIARPGMAERIKTGLRFSAYLEFTHLSNDYSPTSDKGVALPFKMKAGTVWTGGLDLGRLLGVEEDGKAGGRVDASVRWDYHGDTDTQNRFVASVTVTKKVGEVSIPIGLVYANRTAFLSKDAYDHGLSAHVGLKFNLFTGLK